MEKIIIQGNLYKCKNGTTERLRELNKKGRNAPGMDHEKGTLTMNLIKLLTRS